MKNESQVPVQTLQTLKGQWSNSNTAWHSWLQTVSVRDKLPELIQEEMDNQNSPIPIKETALILKNLSIRKTSDPSCSTGEYYQTCKEEAILILQSLPENKKKEILFNSFYEAIITPISKPDKDITQKEN